MMTKQVIFKLGNEEYGMDISLVSAIENYTDVVTMPGAPLYIIGILNLRGDVVPVYSLRQKFGMQEIPADPGTQLLVTRCKGVLVGYKVDSVSEIVEVEDTGIQAMPEIAKRESTSYAKGVMNKNGRMAIILDIENILNEREKKVVKEFAEENKDAVKK